MIKSQKLTVKIEKAVTQRVSDRSDCDLSSVVILMCLKIRESRWGILSQHRFIDFHQSLSYFSELMSLDAVRCQFAKSLLWAHAQITSAGNISDATFQIHLPAMQHPCMLMLGSQVSELSVTGSDLTACMQKTRTVVLHESLLSSEVIFIIKCHCEKCEIAKGWAWPRMSEVNGIHSDGLTSQRQKVWRYERGGREAQGASDSFHPCSLADHRYC